MPSLHIFTFPRFLQEFSEEQIVVLVTNVKKTKQIASFPCIAKLGKGAKSSKVKFSKNTTILVKICGI